MRFTFTLLFSITCYCAAAQLHVDQGILLNLKNSSTILSSYEARNQINSSITGKGALYLNSGSSQQLTSTQTVLDLPTLSIKNAHLVRIKTTLNIHDQLELSSGQLTLFYNLTLQNTTDLVLGTTASILPTSHGQLLCAAQLTHSNPLALLLIQSLLVTTEPKMYQTPQKEVVIPLKNSFFGILPQKRDAPHLKLTTPPPEKTLFVSFFLKQTMLKNNEV